MPSSPSNFNGSPIFGGCSKKNKKGDGAPSEPSIDTFVPRTFCFDDDIKIRMVVMKGVRIE
ncbi:hypothetical protein HAX54_023599, partial [Datura stramonium]|nr:hypothetical protein [Datura stramonium]